MSTETPLELKKTVNLPRTDFAQKADLGRSEPARLERWAEMGLYELIRRERQGRERFVLLDGPAEADAEVRPGAALNKILKDIVVRSRTMLGYDAPYVPAYDCHGPSVEQNAERALAAKKESRADLTAAAFRRACRERAAEALAGRTRDFQRLGVLGRWAEPRLTMSSRAEAEAARLFGRLVGRGYVYRGARPVHWCVNERTALSEAEVEYHERTSPSVYVKFPLSEENLAGKAFKRELLGSEDDPRGVYFLIWTTTPWTLPANLGIAVNPDAEYAAFEANGEVYVVAGELLGDLTLKLGLGRKPGGAVGEDGAELSSSFSAVDILASFPGSRLDRLEARHAWLDRPSLLMVGGHVTLGAEPGAAPGPGSRDRRGTGLVHTAPGHGFEDFRVGKAYDLDAYSPVDGDGRFTAEVEGFAGRGVFEADSGIVELMRGRGALLFAEEVAHRYPHCRRCRHPVISRATPQWFVSLDTPPEDAREFERDEDGRDVSNFTEDVSAEGPGPLRAAALREAGRVEWVPAWGAERMRDALRDQPDWCVSRQRIWGVPIPVFYCRGCGAEVADPSVVNHVADIFERESSDAWHEREARELLPEGYACPACGGAEFAKETDTLDPWFVGGASAAAMLEGQEPPPRPADLCVEGGDQYRGWFNSSLLVGLAAHGRAPYRKAVAHGSVVDGQGRALGDAADGDVTLEQIVRESGAEIVRLWAASSDYREDVRCSAEILRRVADAYRKLRNTARFALGNLDGFYPSTDAVPLPELPELDRWALSELDLVIERALEAYRACEFHAACHALQHFCAVTLSARYFDIVKDRLYTSAPRSHARRSAQTVLNYTADALARLLAPLLAFTADEIWENLPEFRGGRLPPSVHVAEFPVARPGRDAAMRARWERLFEVRDAVLLALEEARAAKLIGGGPEAHVRLEADRKTHDLLEQYRADLRYLFIVSQVSLTLLPEDAGANALRVTVERAAGERCERCRNYSERVGEFTRYPTVCERCVVALAEIEAEGGPAA
ncbi:MAG TPA: isoleucine--tRNA ligase [Pyrinomonadaceae bacterium]|nr:isoleucine--tRNA ligase [Pyrinomonadaceae bacterium]